MNIDLRTALHFVVIAEEMSFTRAARRLGIAQPSLSQQIRQLESRLSTPLFDRTTRSVQLTSAGQALLQVAAPLSTISLEISRAAKTISSGRSAIFRIGAPPYSSKIYLRNLIIDKIAEDKRKSDIELEVGWSPHLIDRLLETQLDATFALGPIDDNRLHVIPIGTMWRVLVFEPNDPLRIDGPVSASDLKGRAVAVFPRGSNPSVFDNIFGQLREANVELIPVELDGHPLARPKSKDPLIFSYFRDMNLGVGRGERALAGSAPVPFSFVTRHSDNSKIAKEVRRLVSQFSTLTEEGAANSLG